jgi:hypothetical protein
LFPQKQCQSDRIAPSIGDFLASGREKSDPAVFDAPEAAIHLRIKGYS